MTKKSLIKYLALLFSAILVLSSCTGGVKIISSDTSSVHSREPDGEDPFNLFITNSVENFVEWAKSGGKGYDKYPENQPFIEWAKEYKTLLLPVSTNKEISFDGIGLMRSRRNYATRFKTPDNNYIDVEFYYLDETSPSRENVKTAYNDCKSKNPKYFNAEAKLKKGGKTKKWGTYYYANGLGEKRTYSNAYFITSGFLVCISIPSEKWDKKYFDYFDFETVTWK